MSNQDRDTNVELYIDARPQITVALTQGGEIEISTARIAEDFEKVVIEEVVIPMADADRVARAILDLVQRAKG